VDAGNEKELAQLREFAGQAEPLSPEDLDEEFIMAAHVAYAVENLSEPRKQERRRFGYQAKV